MIEGGFEADKRRWGVFSVTVTPHTSHHSYITQLLYHRQPVNVIQALAVTKTRAQSTFTLGGVVLEVAASLNLSFSGQCAQAAALLGGQPRPQK